MASENETHEEVCAEMRSFGDMPPPMFAWRDLANRAEAAHKRELATKDAEIERLKQALEVITNYDLSSIERFPLDDEDKIVVYADGEDNGLGCSYNQLNEQQQRVIVQSVNAIRKAQEIVAKAQGVRDGE